jgi:hypothetical protein
MLHADFLSAKTSFSARALCRFPIGQDELLWSCFMPISYRPRRASLVMLHADFLSAKTSSAVRFHADFLSATTSLARHATCNLLLVTCFMRLADFLSAKTSLARHISMIINVYII